MDIITAHSIRQPSNGQKSRRGRSKKKHVYDPEVYNRLKGVQMIKPIVYGNLSWKLLPEQQRDCHTHQWIIYVRGYNDEDISAFVKCVQFKLHVSYDTPNRVCYAPPYQVTETGWGEFEVVIRIHFKDEIEKPVTLYHYLKLINKDKEDSMKPIVSEFYDELIFSDPTLNMYQLLRLEDSTVPGPTKVWIDHEEKKAQDLEKILEANLKLKMEISDMRVRLADARSIIATMKSRY